MPSVCPVCLPFAASLVAGAFPRRLLSAGGAAGGAIRRAGSGAAARRPAVAQVTDQLTHVCTLCVNEAALLAVYMCICVCVCV